MTVDAVARSATFEIAADVATDQRTQKRLQEHVTLLQSLGVPGLASLGTLRISGSVVPRPGLTLPSAAKQTAAIPGDTAYWVASAIDLAPDTTVILKQPCRKLTIIAEKVTVGAHVAFTWEPPAQPVLPALPKPAKRPQAPTPGGPQGVAGEAGSDGSAGGAGGRGLDAPELEIWLMELAGTPSFVLNGQDGGAGGAGQPGGDGGDGSTGRPELYDVFGYCKSGPGNGGDGGPGGKGGGGGPGGAGGNGGRLSFYAPQSVLSASSSLLATVNPGPGAAGGPAGIPGAGGAGGQQGYFNRCPPPPGSPRTGNPGRPGALGVAGRAGEPGKRSADAVGFYPITADMFGQALIWPAISNLSPNRATAGQLVTVTGLRFLPGATVLVEGVAAPTTVSSDTLLTFPVPAVPGGQRVVQVRQADGTLSSKATLYVLPAIASTDQVGRVRPGTKVTLVGSGFAPGAQVRVNDQTMPDVAFIDPNHVACTLVRPSSVAPNAAGEQVTVRLVLADGTASNEIPLVLDTVRMLVLGDSIQWGQGLPDDQKFHALVQATVQAKPGNIGVYKEVLAHSGATIGVGDQTILPPIQGEVPTPYPTVWQQVDAVTDQPQMIDIVLVDGGLNDVMIARVVDPTVKPEELSALMEKHCHVGMRQLLEKITAKFPNAQIVVTGYYPIVSRVSNSKLLKPLLIAFGVKATALGGGKDAALSEALKSRVVANCRLFAAESTTKLQAAVDETNAALGGLPRVFFAIPGFTEKNSALAPDSLLWGVTADSSPQDPVAANRLKLCKANKARSDQLWCSCASAGHPNARGAQEYARVITAALTLGP